VSKKYIIANWKMNPQSVKEAELIFSDISKVANLNKHLEIIVCPPYPFLYLFRKLRSKNFFLGAQNSFFEKEGAYTGEISSSILKNFGVDYVILGHSERREGGEDNLMVNKKILLALKTKLKPILCLGEKIRDNEGKYLVFVHNQIKECLEGVLKNQIKDIIFAYEPVWAIGQKAEREATPEEFIEIKIFIKKVIADLYDVKTAENVKVIYGGSVDESNTSSFMNQGQADGLLIGRNSLISKKFIEIIKLIK
jgi:triosephosphate isomerase (TIM)